MSMFFDQLLPASLRSTLLLHQYRY